MTLTFGNESEARNLSSHCSPTTVTDGARGTGRFQAGRDCRMMDDQFDRFGIAQHEPGAKFDSGKPRAGLVLGGFARALMAVAAVGTYGAAKYTDDGWTSVPDGKKRYTDAMWRHLLAEASGEHQDQESDQLHAAHVAWNALARLDLMLRDDESFDSSRMEEE